MRQGCPPRSPHQPPQLGEGDLWGDLHAVGQRCWRTAVAAGHPTHPPPLPVRAGAVPTPRPPVGGSEEVRARGSVCRARFGPGRSLTRKGLLMQVQSAFASPSLVTRFSSRTRTLRSDQPLDEVAMRAVAPSIFAPHEHVSRSERYVHIPTIEVLRAMRREGFEPYMVAQGATRIEGREAFTKHMVRMRHAGDVGSGGTGARPEVREVILVNSHDGASAFQMLAGVFRFVCCNGLVAGEVVNDIRVPHKGQVQDVVVEGALDVLHQFEAVEASTRAMKATQLDAVERMVYARAAHALRFGLRLEGQTPAAVTAEQLLTARRFEDLGSDLWSVFQRVQENVIRGGLPGRSAQGKRMHTRPVGSLDRDLQLNRAMWVLAEQLRRRKVDAVVQG